jgi:PPOX class probable F420-dependent enzyme
VHDRHASLAAVRTNLTPDQLDGLLDSNHLAVLATTRQDGTALLSPVWFIWEDGGFTVGINAGDVKLRHILRDPQVTILVYEDGLPYRGFEVQGTARIVDLPYGANMRRIGRRYLGPAIDPAYPDDAEGSIVRIEPGRTRGWDFSDDFASFTEAAS